MSEENPERPIYAPDQHSTYQFDAPFFGPPERSFETNLPRKKTDYCDAPVDIDKFLGWFYEFNNEELWPIKLIETCAKRARLYVTVWAQCDQLDGEDREYARALLIAHICVLTKRTQMQTDPSSVSGSSGVVTSSGVGQVGGVGILTSASVGGVNVSMTLPESQNTYEFWLHQTLYGIEFHAFLSNHVPVAVYSEGDDLRSCLRD